MFSEYLSKSVKVDLNSGWYYSGKVLEVNDSFLSLIDFKGNHVTIAIKDIVSIREVNNGNS